MVEQLHAETPLPLEGKIAIFPKWTPPSVGEETFPWFQSSAERQQDDESVLKRQSFFLYQLV